MASQSQKSSRLLRAHALPAMKGKRNIGAWSPTNSKATTTVSRSGERIFSQQRGRINCGTRSFRAFFQFVFLRLYTAETTYPNLCSKHAASVGIHQMREHLCHAVLLLTFKFTSLGIYKSSCLRSLLLLVGSAPPQGRLHLCRNLHITAASFPSSL